MTFQFNDLTPLSVVVSHGVMELSARLFKVNNNILLRRFQSFFINKTAG